jgi:hypothetical protein
VQNPYAPPSTSASPVQPYLDESGRRSLVPRVLGVLSLVFSGLALLFGLIFIGTSVAAYKAKIEVERELEKLEAEKSGKKELRSSAPSRTPKKPEPPIPVMIGALLLTATLIFGTVALLVLGIGQVRYRPWSYRFSVIWSWAAIVGLVAGGALVALHREGVVAALMLIPWLVYPIVTLSLITGRRARASLGR